MIWPLKQKMTVDYFASELAEAIEENISVYHKAIENHAAENVSEEQIASLEPELWALELAVIDLVLALTKFPPLMAEKLVPMLVVGYSPLNSDTYSKRAMQYAEAVGGAPADKVTVVLGKTFVSISGIQFRVERTDVNRHALEWAIAAVATGSLEALADLTADTLKNFKIY